MRSSPSAALLAATILAAACSRPGASDAAPTAPVRAGPALELPLDCDVGRSCEVQHYVDLDSGPGVRDHHGGRRTYDGHKGVDIRIPDMAAQKLGVNVLAAADGRVARVRDGVADVSIRAAGAPEVDGQECGNGVVIDHGQGWETQYCHLAKGSLIVAPGQTVGAGQPIAQVGLSGNTEFAHLHVSVRHDGVVVDPFAPPAGAPLWTPAALEAMRYKAGAVLNAGFAPGPVTMDAVEAAATPPLTDDPPALVAYARAIELEGGDEVELRLKAPDGSVLAESRTPLERDKAQHLVFVGRKRPPAGWAPGLYRADYTVYRAGEPVVTRAFETEL